MSKHCLYISSSAAHRDAVNSGLILAMKAIISGRRSKRVDEFKGQSFDYVLTVCDNAKESCPVFPGHAKRLHRAFNDLAVFQSREEGRLALFRRVRDEIQDDPKTFSSSSTRNLEQSRWLSKEYRAAHPRRHQGPFQVPTR